MTPDPRIDPARTIRAPRGTERTAKSWLTEAALRMLMNNLDPEVAENPKELVVYGGIGRAARDWECFDAIVEALRRARRRRDAARPVGEAGRRVQDARGRAARADRELEPRPALGDVGALQRARPQGPDDVRPDDGRARGSTSAARGSCRARTRRSPRRGGSTTAASSAASGSSPPASAAWAARSRSRRRWPAPRCSRSSASRARIDMRLADALPRSRRRTTSTRRSRSSRRRDDSRSRSGCSATPRRSSRRSSRRGVASRPSVTDQTSAHDPAERLPARAAGRSSAGASCGRKRSGRGRDLARAKLDGEARERDARASRRRASRRSTTATTSARMAKDEGVANAFDYPGFVPAYIRPLFCEGKGPFRWVALSGDPEDIYKTDRRMLELFPTTRGCTRWLDMAKDRIAFQGLPARICWLGLGERHLAGLAFNEMVAKRRAQGADRHRPRPPRHRLGREPEPRDRSRCATARTPCPTGRCSTRS